MPSSTVTATSTRTPQGTETPAPTTTQPFVFVLPGSTSSLSAPTLAGINNGTANSKDGCQINSVEPPNNTVFSPRTDFIATWSVKNIGREVWYRATMEYAYVRGDKLVHLVTVHPPLRVYGEIQLYVGDKKAAEMAAQHNREILEPAEQVLRSSGVAFASSTAEGDAAEKIVECAKAVGAGEIVMGSLGLGRIAGLVMGSVTTKVVHMTQVPVTLVK